MGHCAIAAHPVPASSFSLCLYVVDVVRLVAGDVAFARPEARSHAHGAMVNEVDSTSGPRGQGQVIMYRERGCVKQIVCSTADVSGVWTVC